MTLVVAQLFSDGPRLLADSQLTFPGGPTNPYTSGAVKAVILHPALCVAFSGGALTGSQAIVDLHISPTSSFDVDEVCKQLHDEARHGDGDNDFIVATLAPDKSLTRIDASGISRGRDYTWIGHPPAHAAYNEHLDNIHAIPSDEQIKLLPADRREELGVWNRIFPALNKVLEDDRYPLVAGFPTGIAPTSTGFRYESSALLAASHEQVVEAEDAWVDADWGSAADGSFGYAVKTPDVAGIGALGMYFPDGRIGVLYWPCRFVNSIVFDDVSDAEFTTHVEQGLGVPFGKKSIGFT